MTLTKLPAGGPERARLVIHSTSLALCTCSFDVNLGCVLENYHLALRTLHFDRVIIVTQLGHGPIEIRVCAHPLSSFTSLKNKLACKCLGLAYRHHLYLMHES